jgi:hypothetical protein
MLRPFSRNVTTPNQSLNVPQLNRSLVLYKQKLGYHDIANNHVFKNIPNPLKYPELKTAKTCKIRIKGTKVDIHIPCESKTSWSWGPLFLGLSLVLGTFVLYIGLLVCILYVCLRVHGSH